MSYDPIIRTEFLKRANSYELVLRELSDKFIKSGRSEHSYIDEMYLDIVDLAKMIYCNHGTYYLSAMDDITHELACDIITRYKTKPDYELFAWYKYIRLVLLRFRDNYIKINSSQVYQPFHNDERTIWHRHERTDEIIESELASNDIQRTLDKVFKKSVDKLNELSRLSSSSPNYFSTMINLLHELPDNPMKSRYVLNNVKSFMREEVI